MSEQRGYESQMGGLDEKPLNVEEYVRTGYLERASLRERVDALSRRMDDIDAGQVFMIDQLDASAAALERNTQMTTANASMVADLTRNTAGIVSVTNDLKGFATVCGYIAKFGKQVAYWVILPGGGIAALWLAAKDFLKSIGKTP